MVMAQTTGGADSNLSEFKKTKTKASKPTKPSSLQTTSSSFHPDVPGQHSGKSSEACHLEDDSYPQQAHPDTSGAATGFRKHGAALGFSFWKQTPAEIEGAELVGGTVLLILKKPGERWNCSNLSPYFAPVPQGGRRGATEQTL